MRPGESRSSASEAVPGNSAREIGAEYGARIAAEIIGDVRSALAAGREPAIPSILAAATIGGRSAQLLEAGWARPEVVAWADAANSAFEAAITDALQTRH